jgi:RNA polymerase sigma-32 factor
VARSLLDRLAMSPSPRTASTETSAKPDFARSVRQVAPTKKAQILRSVPAVNAPDRARLEIAADNDVWADTAPRRPWRADRSAINLYLRSMRRHPLLAREEEHEIAVQFVKTGDSDLATRLINANLRLVLKIAFEYRHERRNLLDLVQEGNLGLIHAVHKYDPDRDVKLSTYASWWIRANILKFILSNSRLVKVGTTQTQRRLFFGLRKERRRMESRGDVVDANQIAKALHVSEKEVIEMEGRLSFAETSLDSPVRQRDEGDRTYGDLVQSDSHLRPDRQSEEEEFGELLRQRLEEFGQTLSGRDVDIFRNRLLSEEAAPRGEIAERFGVSRERIRQIENRLKKRIRLHLEAWLGDAVQMAN